MVAIVCTLCRSGFLELVIIFDGSAEWVKKMCSYYATHCGWIDKELPHKLSWWWNTKPNEFQNVVICNLLLHL